MKELSIEEKAKRYDEAIKKVNDYYEGKTKLYSNVDKTLDCLFPELKESEDERVRKWLIKYFNKADFNGMLEYVNGIKAEDILAWLERQKVTDEEIIFRPVVGTDIRIAAKQALEKIDIGKKVVLAFNGAYIPVNGKTVGEIDSEYDAWLKKQSDINETINKDEFAQGVLRGAAINLITWIDYNTAKGNMCLSNMECRVIEDALVSGDWDKIYAYIKRKLEKQGKQKSNPYSGTSFEYNGHTWGMCARDNGVEILFDGELKAFLSLDKSFIYPIHPQPNLAPKNAMEAIKEEKVDNANKIEPKFKVDDFIKHNKANIICKVIAVNSNNNSYYVENIGIGGSRIELYNAKQNFHLWTIKDAKDGDVLFQDLMDGKTFIYGGINPDGAILYSFLINNSGEDVLPYNIGKLNTGIGYIKEHKNIIYPATKEQRELLFKKMKEAGYEWDAEKKELKKIEQKSQRMISAGAKEALYSNSAWSEEDTFMYNKIKNLLTDISLAPESRNSLFDWLKALKDRVQPQWKPSEEQIRTLEYYMHNLVCSEHKEVLFGLYEQLKKLKGE